MALHAGMRVVHIDVNRTTLHMDPDRLARCLTEHNDSETVLLVDHSFGYPAAEITEWRRDHPQLLIIEDCVRALGSEIHGKPVGHDGDWVLFSLYKTTVGNDHGAVLLTRSPYALGSGPPPGTTFRQWASGVGPLRVVHGLSKRLRPDIRRARRDLETPFWSPAVGVPNRLCLKRFEHQLLHLADDQERRRKASQEIRDTLGDVEAIQFIPLKPGCQGSAFFLSFTVEEGVSRDRLVTALHRKGLFLAWAWNAVPAFYRCFSQTFPYGSAESVFLADHVCHIPLGQYLAPRRRRRLISCLQTVLAQR